MPYDKTITIANFKFGLDTRREELVSQPGTLLTLNNAHINQGGEIEKRGAFILDGLVGPLDSNTDPGTFGLETTDQGPTVFGSALPHGTFPTPQSQPTLASAIPAPAVYQQLQHPALTLDNTINYNRNVHRMIAVLCSENFNGKAIVAAQFNDNGQNTVFLYYNGSIIFESQNGRILTGMSDLTHITNELSRQFNAIPGWFSSIPGSGLTRAAVNSPASDYYTPICSFTTSGAGGFGTQVVATDQPAVIGARAQASFKLVQSSAGTIDIQVSRDGTANGTLISLTNGPVNSSGTATLTATNVATLINTLTFIHGFSAVNNTVDIFVLAPLSFGNFTGNLNAIFTGGLSSSASTLSPTIPLNGIITANPAPPAGTTGVKPYDTLLQIIKIVPRSTQGSYTFNGTAVVQVLNNTGNITYTYNQIGTNANITFSSNLGSSPQTSASQVMTITASATLGINSNQVARYKIHFADTVPNTGDVYLTVQFVYAAIGTKTPILKAPF